MVLLIALGWVPSFLQTKSPTFFQHLKHLEATYPLGYVIFDLGYTNQIADVVGMRPTLEFEEYELDWSGVRFLENSAIVFKVQLPKIKLKDGTLLGESVYAWSKSVWPTPVYVTQVRPSIGITMVVSLLETREGALTFLLGFSKAKKPEPQ